MSEPIFHLAILGAPEVQDSTKPAQKAEPIELVDVKMPPLRALRAQAEVKGIQYALELTGWNRKRAARLLKISYRGLLYKIRQHNINRNVAETS